MKVARWHGAVLARSPQTVEVEGNHYFPPETLDRTLLRSSTHTSHCPWKGRAHYYDVVVDGAINADAAWYYPSPEPAAAAITDYVAFWRGVTVSEE